MTFCPFVLLSFCPFALLSFFVRSLTEQQQFDVLGSLDAILLEVLLNLLAARPGCALLGAHGAAHDDGLEGAQGHGAEGGATNRRSRNKREEM